MSITKRSTRIIGVALAATAAVVGSVAGSANAHGEPQGYIQGELGVGYFYGTFNEGPNMTLLAGGTAEEFCLDNPGDPFAAEPGVAPLRIFLRNDGTVDLKVNDKDQPIYLYEQTFGDAPTWIANFCDNYFAGNAVPEPYAEGTADLKVRISIISDDLVDVFNSVNGELVASDGTEYRVRASADLVVENGVPVGDPVDFVSFDLKEIRR